MSYCRLAKLLRKRCCCFALLAGRWPPHFQKSGDFIDWARGEVRRSEWTFLWLIEALPPRIGIAELVNGLLPVGGQNLSPMPEEIAHNRFIAGPLFLGCGRSLFVLLEAFNKP